MAAKLLTFLQARRYATHQRLGSRSRSSLLAATDFLQNAMQAGDGVGVVHLWNSILAAQEASRYARCVEVFSLPGKELKAWSSGVQNQEFVKTFPFGASFGSQ